MQRIFAMLVHCADVEDAKHVLSNWQGTGPGRLIVGPGPLAVIETCVETAFVVAGTNEAEASPAKAMNRAKMRMATFIFSNLMDSNLKGKLSPFQ